jgi:rhamnosyltransferase
MDNRKTAVIIPTLNGGEKFQLLMQSIVGQKLTPYRKIVIDSGSTDETVDIAFKYGCEVIKIDKKDFDHGSTRQMGVRLADDADILVFLTQDAILADENALSILVACFADSKVGVAYGRQLPHAETGPIGSFARIINYPDKSLLKTMADKNRLGIKTPFLSNSFAAYRRNCLNAAGGFPSKIILCEDTYVAANMLLAGWKICYCAQALVYHAHDYNLWQEFHRYYAIGRFHAREAWIRRTFGEAEGEGLRFVLSEMRYLWKTGNPHLLPSAWVRTVLKYIGFRLGLMEQKIPKWLKTYLTTHGDTRKIYRDAQ